MNRFKTKIVGLTIAALMSAGSLIPMVSSAVTIDELLAQIVALQAQLQTLQGGSSTVSTADKCSFTRSLTVGSRGDDVTCLQKYLTSAGHYTYSGGATGYFGSITRTAVAAWQSANGVSPTAGYFGSISRAKYDSLMATTAASSASSVASSAASSASSVAATGEGLTITAATQPAATLAVKSAARLPFTKVTLTAGAQDVVVTGVTVERTGLANDAAFSGVVLLDETGTQLGIAKTFNSDHKATVGDTVTIKAGTSKTFTVAGNMASDQTSYAGQVAYLSVTGVTTSATVSGLLPISGAGHTINNSLTIGSVTMAIGANDPQNNPSKEIGSTGYTFSAVKITSGSAEKIRVRSIRWNQSGSAAAADLANIKTYVDGTAYDAVVSSDGKYFTSTLGDGIVVDKGANIQASIKGDIIGGSGRTIDFDVYKTTDLNISGETYGYGITPPNGSDDSGTDDSAFHATTNPWYDASQVTVSSGTWTVEKASSIAAQSIAVNVANQPLGGFTVEAKGEPVSVASMVFRLSAWAGTGGATTVTQDITNITLVDENGTVVAGPVDVAASAATVTFTDTITFAVGKKTYTLKGKVGTEFANNQTIAASTTPSSDWTTVTGQTTGNSITPSPTSAITANTMTVKSAVTTISVSATPASQTVVAGAQSYAFANVQFDATASGEDIKFSTVPLTFTNGGTASYITGCTLYDGSMALNTGGNTVTNPTATPTFTLDSNLTIPKGTVKTVALKCNIAGSATTSSTFLFGIPAAASWSGTGVTSSQSATITATAASSGTMTIGAGSFTVALDSSSPSYYLAAANTTGNTAAILKFHANNEAIDLQKVSLQLTNPSASSSPNDIVKVTLWDGSTQVGEAIFTGSNRNATSTLTTTVTIPKDGDKLITVKTDLAEISSTGIGTQGAFVAVDYDGADSTGTQGVGSSSGGTVNQGSTSDTASSGFRMFKSHPTVAKVSVPTNTLSNGTMSLARFKITANSTGDVGLYKFTIRISTTTATVSSVNAYAYTDSGFSSAISGVGSAGKLLNTDLNMTTLWASASTQLEIYPQTTAAASTTVQISAGQSRYFDITATIAGATTGASVSTQVEGDAAYASSATLMSFYNTLDTDTHNDFIWSPNATTSSTLLHRDWSNGYGVSGLPSANLTADVLSR